MTAISIFHLTFGQKYAREPHPVGHWVHPDGVVEIWASSYLEARQLAVQHFGDRWGGIYDADRNKSLKYYPRGVLAVLDATRGITLVGQTPPPESWGAA